MVANKNNQGGAGAVSDKAISVVQAEWEALAGLPYLQVRLYLVLRWYMSMATGRVGEQRGISLQGLCEELYVEPAPGRVDSGAPTKKAVRSALLQLEKHGLVRPCGNGEVLVFFLPKAGSTSARAKTKGHKRGTGSGQAIGHSETQPQQWIQDDMGHVMGQTENPLKGHTSEVRVNHPSTQASAAACSAPVDNSAVLLQMPLQAERVAEWIRLQERQRGCRSKAFSRAAQIAEWMALAVTGEELHEAYSLAKGDRESTQNRAPINLPFLGIFVQRVIAQRRVCRENTAAPAVPLWRNSAAGVRAKAKEAGLEPGPDESLDQLRGRVELALMHREEAERQQRKAAGSKRGGELCPI